ncbi:MAG: SUMF1/EgtB/PvdO family nonheme iron enzyme [Pseudoxanthomonas sp.]
MSDNDSPQRQPVHTEFKFSHVTTGRYLPGPGKAPGWPFADIGQWKIETVPAWQDWLTELRDWRREHLVRIGYDDSNYRRPELQWAQSNFVHAQMMVEDRYFHDPSTGRYTVDRYLDDLQARFGGIDSVLVWYIYPNIGIDDRNQFDMAHDLPGGLQGLKSVVDAFHRRGVRVFLPTMPWDHGTRQTEATHWESMARILVEVGADGINGDTYNGVPRAFFDACLALGRPVVLQPESTISAEEQLVWNVQSWGKKAPNDFVPPLAKFKWLEPRHMINYENRWGRDRRHDLQYTFFNGIGYNAWENVWGIWNGLTERDAQTLRRITLIQRRFSALFVAMDWAPYWPTLLRGVFASRFPGQGCALWTLVNRLESPLRGELLRIEHTEGARYYDLWHGAELAVHVRDGHALLELEIEALGFGAVLVLQPGTEAHELPDFLHTMQQQAQRPLADLSSQWRALAQQCVEVPATPPEAVAPDGMVTVPAGEFVFAVAGIEVEGGVWDGVDVQYPWEDSARRFHRQRLQMAAFHIDRTPVTNAQFKAFLDASGYVPADAHNFLRHWRHGVPVAGTERQPVAWVALEDARAYAAWAGKRLPREWEWQYAAQGPDGRAYPWGDAWDEAAVPAPHYGPQAGPPADVEAHPRGASPFGVLDLVGNVWQWTDEYLDEHTRAAVLRGGSRYRPQTSHWYFPQALRLDQHGKYLLMAPCRDRSAFIGFRCVVDAR